MQRKNNILRKNGFAMMMALGVLIALASIMALSFSLSSTTTKRTIDSYVKKQAELYAKNAAEYVLFKISKASDNCMPNNKRITFTENGIYNININIDYAYSNVSCSDDVDDDGDGNASNDNDNNYVTLQAVDEDDKYAYVKIDVTVDVNDSSVNTEPIRIFRRYIEDITEYIH